MVNKLRNSSTPEDIVLGFRAQLQNPRVGSSGSTSTEWQEVQRTAAAELDAGLVLSVGQISGPMSASTVLGLATPDPTGRWVVLLCLVWMPGPSPPRPALPSSGPLSGTIRGPHIAVWTGAIAAGSPQVHLAKIQRPVALATCAARIERPGGPICAGHRGGSRARPGGPGCWGWLCRWLGRIGAPPGGSRPDIPGSGSAGRIELG